MDVHDLASLQQMIVGGVRKQDCPYVTDAASSKLWDTLAAECAALAKDGMIIDAPTDL